MACSFSTVNGFIWAAFIHVAIQRRFSRSSKRRTWQNYWFGGFLTRLTWGTLIEKSLPSLSLSLSSAFLVFAPHTLALGCTPQSKQSKEGVWLWEKGRARPHEHVCVVILITTCPRSSLGHIPRQQSHTFSRIGRKLTRHTFSTKFWYHGCACTRARTHTHTHTSRSNLKAQTEL